MAMDRSKPVLFTGCSTGIGRGHGRAPRSRRLERLRHRPAAGDDREPDAERGEDPGSRRERRELDALRGLMWMCQLVLPGMRKAGSGRIVNVSSMGGKLTFPGGGVYHATKHVGSIDGTSGEGPYAKFNEGVAKATAEAYDGPFARFGGGPEAVAAKIEKALSARRPSTRYKVTPSAGVIMGMRRGMTDRMWDRFVSSQYPRPKPDG